MSDPRFLCLSVPELDLQLVRRRQSIPVDAPLLIVEADRPSARVTACNTAATTLGVRVGIRYSEALSLSGMVRAGAVAEHERVQAVEEIRILIGQLLPAVEVWELDNTVFWGDARGMRGLGVGSQEWFHTLQETISQAGWSGGIALGWTRPGTFCAARKTVTFTVFSSLEAELRWYRSCSLAHVPLTGRDRERLSLLGLRRVEDLIAIREEQLGVRFSAQLREVHRFLRRASGDTAVRGAVESPVAGEAQGNYEPPLCTIPALVSACMELVQRVIPDIAEQGRWIRSVQFCCTDDQHHQYTEEIECGRLTRNPHYVRRLIALRLENRSWRAREITAITLSVGAEEAGIRQETLDVLFEETPSSDTEHIDETLAYIRARLGNEQVFRMRLYPRRLPEHRYQQEPIASVREMLPSQVRPGDGGGDTARDAVQGGAEQVVRIRRIFDAGPTPFRSRVPPLLYGPFVQAGEWWERDESDRVYSYHRRSGGEILWLYRLAHGGPWMLQGYVS